MKKHAPSVTTTPAPQGVEDGSSGDAHPVERETNIKSKIQKCIEEIVEIAHADNGALLEGDSAHLSRTEALNTIKAAQHLLATLYSCMGGSAPRAEEEVLQAMLTPIERRQYFVNGVAAARGLHAGQWYAEQPLSDKDMGAAVLQWKYDFPMNPHLLKKIEAWEQEDTESSNKKSETFATVLLRHTFSKRASLSSLPCLFSNFLRRWSALCYRNGPSI